MTAKYFWKAISPKHNFSNNKNIFLQGLSKRRFSIGAQSYWTRLQISLEGIHYKDTEKVLFKKYIEL